MNETKLLSVKDVAAELAVSQRQVWKLHASQRLPRAVRLGRSVRWRAADIAEWIAAGCPTIPEPASDAARRRAAQ